MKTVAVGFAGLWLLVLLLMIIFVPSWRVAAAAMLPTPFAMLVIILCSSRRNEAQSVHARRHKK